MLFAGVAAFGLTWWLGLYVIVREPRERGARRAGAGLLCYGLALAAWQVRGTVAEPWAAPVAAAATALTHLPALLWTGAVLTLVPGGERLERLWARAFTLDVNALWAVTSVILPLAGGLSPNALGIAFVVAQAVVVIVVAELQYIGLRRSVARPA
ncbi:hypothetical protein GCM10010106_16410 [Thermopolyspora flexuosa]|jgi:hypothetical protein|uniref:Uncharacterized protein n=1 Tax=Thermopolyspora flexuosa TaxID=103836 RepID=A0A543IPA1_9ACTN|nr:hypothetical protein [Thermopolyspora flexuosa]TQM72407.1 hypothetical protein FHX40_4544 [Thermopolyspora flexuosa]GGM70823.1 hypothetical protein GCM10010106_16410 [Thermopolyspora flexuosa]